MTLFGRDWPVKCGCEGGVNSESGLFVARDDFWYNVAHKMKMDSQGGLPDGFVEISLTN